MLMDKAMVMDRIMDMDTEKDTEMDMDIRKIRCQIYNISKIFNLISDIMSDSTLFNPIPEVPVSGPIRNPHQ
jgi:hypothetical protein